MAIIVCPQPVAAEIGLEVMRRGGNAIDAAVTCAFVQGVLDPQMCGIGGCGVMLVHDHGGQDALLEFYSTAGSRTREDMWERLFIREAADRYGYVLEGWVNDVGYQSVGVPGTVAGLHEALTRYGTITWAQAIEPAIPLARNGFPVTGYMHGYWTTDYGPDVVPNRQRIQATQAARAIYTRDGELFAIGDSFVQADLARTLERLADEGPDTFYRGLIAEQIASDFEANGGLITREDLAGYRVNVAEPLRGTYRGLSVVTAGPPSAGVTLLQMLNYLEGYDVGAHGWPSTGAPGGTKIVTAILQVLVNVLDHAMTPVEAVSAPRVDCQGEVVQVEGRIPLAVSRGLEARGYKVNRRTLSYDSYFARPQVIAGEKDGFLHGASDPRKDGGMALETGTE